MTRALPEEEAAALRVTPFTHEYVGATASGPPPGYDWLERSAPLIRRDFDAASMDLFTWRLHEKAGLRVQATASPLRAGSVALMGLGVGRASIRIPCRVAYVIDEPLQRGFAYGTLPGHPEAWEERFLLSRGSDGTITIEITAFSRPASRSPGIGGPVTRRVQQSMTARYLRALDRA